MSVLICGMEMPTSCADCRFCGGIADTGCGRCAWCDVDGKARVADTRQDCPLISVQPHGRLIDANKLRLVLWKRAKEFSNSEYGEGVKCGLADAREYIKIAPTVIPAEEGET